MIVVEKAQGLEPDKAGVLLLLWHLCGWVNLGKLLIQSLNLFIPHIGTNTSYLH